MINFIFGLSLVGFIISLVLLIKNNKAPGLCPPFFNIPACFIAAICYAFVMLSVSFQFWLGSLLFWGGSIIGLILAIWFSYQESFKKASCPKFIQVPLCYASFLAFIILIIMWVFR